MVRWGLPLVVLLVLLVPVASAGAHPLGPPAPTTGSGPGSAGAPGGLVAATGWWWLLPPVAVTALSRRRLPGSLSCRSVLATCCVALLVAVSVQAAPHLAHHALDSDDSCAWLALASHSEGVVPDAEAQDVPAAAPAALPGGARGVSAAERPTDRERAPPA